MFKVHGYDVYAVLFCCRRIKKSTEHMPIAIDVLAA